MIGQCENTDHSLMSAVSMMWSKNLWWGKFIAFDEVSRGEMGMEMIHTLGTSCIALRYRLENQPSLALLYTMGLRN